VKDQASQTKSKLSRKWSTCCICVRL